jgi:hypothetical protein
MEDPSSEALARKLGIKPGITPGMRLLVVGAPDGYRQALGVLPPGTVYDEAAGGKYNLIHIFIISVVDLATRLTEVKAHLLPDGALWVSWVKRAAQGKLSMDEPGVDENVVREMGLKHGLVDVKVIAVDERWSGLKFVYRLEDRPRVSRGG